MDTASRISFRTRATAATIQTLRVRLPPLARPGLAHGRCATRSSSSAPARSAWPGDRPRAARPAGAAARQRRQAVDRLARDLLRQAHAGDLRPARLRRPHGRQGRVVERRQGVLQRRAGLQLRPAARAGHERPAFINLQQYYVEGYLAERAAELPLSTSAGRTRSSASSSGDDGVTLGVETPDGRYSLARRLRRRLRRRALGAAPAARPGEQGPHLPRPLPDRRRAMQARVRRFPAERWFWFDPAVPSATRACCCTGSPTASGASTSSSAGTRTPTRRRSPRTSSRASRRCCAPRSATKCRVRARMGQRLHLRVPAHGRASATAACCSPATRRTACRRSARAAPIRACRTPRTWPGSSPRAARQGRRRAARQLRRRARVRRRREHPQLDARDRLHHAEERDLPPVPRRRARAGARPCRSRAASSTAADCRCRRRCTARR